MKVVSACDGMLTNVEVLGWAREMGERKWRERRKRGRDGERRVDGDPAVVEQLRRYLEGAAQGAMEVDPGVGPSRRTATINERDRVAELLDALDEFGLTAREKVMMVNQRPSSILHVLILVANCDQRMTEETLTVRCYTRMLAGHEVSRAERLLPSDSALEVECSTDHESWLLLFTPDVEIDQHSAATASGSSRKSRVRLEMNGLIIRSHRRLPKGFG
mmetsp:Transcript_5041/g.10215  ORF Transcript_5041/g.10215 Transcript_5041/m.10215 type:complete len:218 (+) Transcript_5041:86-739(+)